VRLKSTATPTRFFFTKKEDNNESWLFKSVKVHDIAVADIAIVDNNRPFRGLDYELLNRFAKIVAIEMEKNEFYKDNKGVMYSYFLADLLSGKLQNQKSIEQRMKILNWKMYKYFQLVVINDPKNGLQEDKIQFIGSEVRNIISDCRWTYYKKDFVLFLSRPSEEMTTQHERMEFRRFISENKLSAGVSSAFLSLHDTFRYYTQALRSSDSGGRINHGGGVFYYDEMLPYCIAMLLSKRYDLGDFRPACLEKIQCYDEENGTCLLETLEQYLLHVGDPVEASKALNIHRNTLLYRINKIKEFTGIDLGNGDERLKIQLWLKFNQYQKNDWQ